MVKKIRLISKGLKNLTGTINSSQYIGNKVLSKSGEYVGRVKDIVFKNNSIVGFLVKDILIGREFVESKSKKVLMLSIEPVTNIIGKTVFDSLGKKIGKVHSLKRKSSLNTYSDLLIKKSKYSKAFSVPKKDVEVSKKSVILNNSYE